MEEVGFKLRMEGSLRNRVGVGRGRRGEVVWGWPAELGMEGVPEIGCLVTEGAIEYFIPRVERWS